MSRRFSVGDKVTVPLHPEHDGEVIAVVYRIRANGPRGAVHLHTAEELSPIDRIPAGQHDAQ